MLIQEDEPMSSVLVNEDASEHPRNRRDGIMTGDSVEMGLPLYLRLFFGLNGLTLSLEGLGLMYIINSRVEMPIPYLPTYGAIAFLPCSFKPIYGYLSQGVTSRFKLFATLLLGNAIFVASTMFIPKGAVVLACMIGFLRGVTDSWAEFCLGLTLIDCARAQSVIDGTMFDALASKFQAHAATARNVGSFLGYVCTFVMFTGRQFLNSNASNELSAVDANILLISSATLQLAGVVYAGFFAPHVPVVELPRTSHSLLDQERDHDDPEGGLVADEMSSLRDDERSHGSYSSTDDAADDGSIGARDHSGSSLFRYNSALVVLLQITVLIFALQTPIVDLSSHLLWKVCVVSCLGATIVVGLASFFSKLWATSHSVALYLILRNALPSDSMVLGSYFYWLFQSSPGLLQCLSLLGSGIITLSSWSYGRYLSKYHSGGKFMILIAVTTVLAGIASLGNIIVFRHSQSKYLVCMVVFVKVVETFFGEWSFLPNVILATTSLNPVGHGTPNDTGSPPINERRHDNVGVKYGTLISCIDFGDQLGSLIAGPLVALLAISRENDFANLDHLIFICFCFEILSLLLLILLKSKR